MLDIARIARVVWATVRGIALAGSILSCPVIVGYQVLGWLKTGHWHGIALADWVVRSPSRPNGLWAWIDAPDSWYGLHVIVKFLAFDLPVWALLVPVFYFVEAWMGDAQKAFPRETHSALKGSTNMPYIVLTDGPNYTKVQPPEGASPDAYLEENYRHWVIVGTADSEQEADFLIKQDRERRATQAY